MEKFIENTFLSVIRTIMKINAITKEIRIYKLDDEMWPHPEKIYDGVEFFKERIRQGYVYKDDEWQFETLFHSEYFSEENLKKGCGSAMVYRRYRGNELVWARIVMLTPNDYSEENPYILFYIYDMAQKETEFFECYTILNQNYYKIAKADFTRNVFSVIRGTTAELLARKRRNLESFEDDIKYVATEFVHPEDQAAFCRHLDQNYIRNYFKDGNNSYQFFYRRRSNGIYRWVKIRICPAIDCSEENQVYYFFIEDVNKTLLTILDINAAAEYAKMYSEKNMTLPRRNGKKEKTPQGYYENLVEIMQDLTSQYIDYYMVDLEKDIYIMYKIKSGLAKKDIPYVGSYSQMSMDYISSIEDAEIRGNLKEFSTSKKLRELLKNRVMLEYSFVDDKGRKVKTICRKIESINGRPTKVICYSVQDKDDDQRLKIKTFGNFEVYLPSGERFKFRRKQSKDLLAYLVDREGYPITSMDIVLDLLEKSPEDKNVVKYVSTLVRRAMNDLEEAGYPNVIIKEKKGIYINKSEVDCDYYHILSGDSGYWSQYHNEYMKEYSWAEDTNAELLAMSER